MPPIGHGWLEWAWPVGRGTRRGVVVLPAGWLFIVRGFWRRWQPCRFWSAAPLYLSGQDAAATDVWAAAVVVLAAELAFEVGRTVIVDHHMGVDTIALVAMVGALALGQEFAGVIIGLMFSGGQTLEEVASTRARRELTALVEEGAKGDPAAGRGSARAGAGRPGGGG